LVRGKGYWILIAKSFKGGNTSGKRGNFVRQQGEEEKVDLKEQKASGDTFSEGKKSRNTEKNM